MIMSPGILGNQKISCTFCLGVEQHMGGKCALLLSTSTAQEQDISASVKVGAEISKALES